MRVLLIVLSLGMLWVFVMGTVAFGAENMAVQPAQAAQSAQSAQAVPPAAATPAVVQSAQPVVKKRPAAWASGGWAEPVPGTASAPAPQARQNVGEYPNQPAVRTDYRNAPANAGWADPAKSAPSMQSQPRNTELYPSQPAVGTSYRNSGARTGWSDKAR